MKYQSSAVAVFALLTAGACTVVPTNRPTTSSTTGLNWNEAIAKAALSEDYGGYYAEGGILWLGFVRDPDVHLKSVTENPNTRAFLASHRDETLEAAMRNIMASVSTDNNWPIAASVDYRASAIEISSVAPTAGQAGPKPRCSELRAFPNVEPLTMVKIIDNRDCKR